MLQARGKKIGEEKGFGVTMEAPYMRAVLQTILVFLLEHPLCVW
jgi:hypothetical protein